MKIQPRQTSEATFVAEYLRRTRKSAELYRSANEFFPGGDTRTITHFLPYPIFMKSGRGCRLEDVDGNRYLDFVNNYFSLIHGHSNPHVVEALICRLDHGTAYAAPFEQQILLAQHLCLRVPSLEKIRFCNSGTEATMNAVRAARAFTGRNKVLKIEGGFHGSHDAFEISVAPALEMAGPDDAPHPFPEMAGLFAGVQEDVLIAPLNSIGATARIIEKHARELAAVIIEPMLGVGGMIPAAPDYVRYLREATSACGALLIFDEIITLRLAHGGMQEVYNVRPDVTALGKIIGGGLPVGAFGGRSDIMTLFDPREGRLTHGGTFNGNALTMVGGLAAMRLYTQHAVERLNALGEQFRAGLRAALLDLGIAAQITGLGSLAQIHFTSAPIETYRDAARAAKKPLAALHLALLNRGMFMAPRGQWCLSTAMSEVEVDEAIAAFRGALAELQPAAFAEC